ncbi:MAG TPA: hypothetical protein PKE12_11040 [Kiritimatiellia bacterium]|nr:hypothetical protein [Kiritimatiellia bacterium]
MRARTMGMALLGLFAATAGWAAIERDEFRWRARLPDSLASGTLVRVQIPAHVHDGSQSFPADLRLIDDAGRDWPFFIRTPTTTDTLERLPLAALPAPGDEPPRDDAQTLYFDSGLRNTPLRRLALAADEGEFSRAVKVYGRHTATNRWRWMADGGLHRAEGRERDWIDLHNTTFRFLKVEIFHGGEPPLSITNAVAIMEPQELVVQPASSDPAWLYFGAKEHALPRFDLQYRTPRSALNEAETVALGARERNPYRLGREVWRYGRLLLAATLALAGTLALGWLLKRLRTGG